MEPTRSDVRAAILDAMRDDGSSSDRPGTYTALQKAVVVLLHDRGFTEGVEYSDPFGGYLNGVAEPRFREEVWDLIAAGVLVPGKNQHNAEWPHLSLTEPGKALIDDEVPTPADPDGYVSKVDRILPGERSRVLLYLREAVGAFNRRLYIASTVMLGVAAEGLVLRLAEAVASAFEDREEGQDWYEENIEGEFVAIRQFRAVRDQIELVKSELPYEVKERFEAHWRSIHTLLRLERNEAGHPSGVERSRDETHGSLLLFPALAQIVRDFEDWASSRVPE